ncbi:hypothetical protein [Acinetobacter sp.]|uniref:hypothetical protein n=1 Tax=Acinetobacter sp. TaxID=472 RepID=UPI000C09C656|nr:hypothetical protein [Acinetobacter sp.]MAK31993.1 hypothetical protein [Acinetobacter sp.]
MDHIKEVLIDFCKSLKSKRVVSGILTILLMAAWNYFELEQYGITEETVNNMVITITGLIVADSLASVNQDKKRE